MHRPRMCLRCRPRNANCAKGTPSPPRSGRHSQNHFGPKRRCTGQPRWSPKGEADTGETTSSRTHLLRQRPQQELLAPASPKAHGCVLHGPRRGHNTNDCHTLLNFREEYLGRQAEYLTTERAGGGWRRIRRPGAYSWANPGPLNPAPSLPTLPMVPQPTTRTELRTRRRQALDGVPPEPSNGLGPRGSRTTSPD